MMRWRKLSSPSKPSASRGFERRMCAPSGQRRPCGILGGVAKAVGARVGLGLEVGDRGVGRDDQRRPVGPAPDDLGRELLVVAAAVELGGLAQDVAEERDVLVELAPHHVGARAPERVGRRARQPALGVHARVLVLVAEDELAGRERAPGALRPRAPRRRCAGRSRRRRRPERAGRSRRRSRSARASRAAARSAARRPPRRRRCARRRRAGARARAPARPGRAR